VAGLVVIWWLNRNDRHVIKMMILWGIGIGLVSVVIPYVEQTIERALKILPVQVALTRGLRYTVPIMLILVVWAPYEISKRVNTSKAKSGAVAVFGAALTVLWLYQHPPLNLNLQPLRTCLETGRLVCPLERPTTLELINAIKEMTPPTAVIMPFFGESNSMLSIRYAALRSLAFHENDSSIFFYNIRGTDMLRWMDLYERAAAALALEPDEDKINGLLELAQELNADYVVVLHAEVHPAVLAKLNLDVIFSNEGYSLIRMAD
jgi:hypothetical protein